MSHNLRVNGDRLWTSLMEMAQIGATAAGGCNRQALTPLDGQGRDLFIAWARDAGCSISIDAVGNIFARREGLKPELEPVLTGSHLDTQATGGKFDGVYGVLAGIEVLRALNDHGIVTDRPIEVAVWTNEEGCRFAPAMLGSGVVSGKYDLQFAYSREDRDGVRFDEALRAIGYLGERSIAPRRYAAMLETHIEQGPILEHEGDTVGVVTGIQGAYWFDVTLTGASVHAGPTPMELRRDPWRAAAPIVTSAIAIAERHAPLGRATIGDVLASPGARNTVPETVRLSIDIRHPEAATLEHMVAELRQEIERLAHLANVESLIEQVWHMPATTFAPDLVDLIERTAAAQGHRHRRMVSGAGHDSLHTAAFAPTAMIFVPCAGGVSHNELEDAAPTDITAGANVLLHAILEVASTTDE